MERIRIFLQEKLVALPLKLQFLLLAMFIAITVSAVFLFFMSQNQQEQSVLTDNHKLDFLNEGVQSQQIQEQTAKAKEDMQVETILVDIKGAVHKSGVYECISGQRVKDAIEKVGGVRKEADLQSVNLSQRLTDEMVIYIPKVGEELKESNITAAGVEGNNQGTSSGKISLSRATMQELESLPGIGSKKAQSIIAFRNKQGGFQRVEQLKEVEGIGDKTFERLVPLVVP